MTMKPYIPILDSGHGGLIAGKYQTKGKRSPAWEHGVLYEGARNRWLKNRVKEILDRRRIPYIDISATDKDKPLDKRVNDANKYKRKVSKDFNTYYLSLHANAGGGRGAEVYTYYGESLSDKFATKFIKAYEKAGIRVRKDLADGDPDKEAGFFVLKYTQMPAILIESKFMDSREDYKDLWSIEYLEDEALLIAGVIEDIFKNGLL